MACKFNLLSDFKSSVESLHIATQKPWWQMYNPGFDGQMTDLATGYQFLGGGYRAYNPIYKHFMSQDSFSPFKKIDGYGFGDNNPIMNTDPTGHMPKWFGYAMGGVAIAMACTMTVLVPVAAGALAPSFIAAGLSEDLVSNVVNVNFGITGVMGLVGLASGSLQIASTGYPENKKLGIATQAFGIAGGLVDIGFGMAGGIVGVGMSFTNDKYHSK